MRRTTYKLTLQVSEIYTLLRALDIAKKNPITPADEPHSESCRAMEVADYHMLFEKIMELVVSVFAATEQGK